MTYAEHLQTVRATEAAAVREAMYWQRMATELLRAVRADIEASPKPLSLPHFEALCLRIEQESKEKKS